MWIYFIYIIWLSALAYVDFKTGFVYGRMCAAGIIPVSICIVIFLTKYQDDILRLIISVIIMIIFVKILGKTGCIGDGDADVFMITSVINSVYMIECGINDVSSILFINIVLIYFAIVLFIIGHIKHVDWKHMKMDRCYPLLPSVLLSTIIFGLIIPLLYN